MSERFPERVVLREVSRTFGRSFALHRVSLELSSSAITAVVGDNGAGKSTLLNILATVDEPTSGTVAYGGQRLPAFQRNSRHRIGWISHQSLLYEELTARENLEFFARMYGIEDRGWRVDSWLERVGLADDADRRVRNFSRGMKQRLTIARALIQNPQLLLLDEPATGLDQQGNEFLIDLLKSLRQRGRIIVLVSHDFELLDGLIDQLVILRRGTVSYDRGVDPSMGLLEAYRAHA